MGTIHDMIIPSVIVGMLLTLILGVQMMMVESSVENRVTQELQGFADYTVQVVQQETRLMNELIAIGDSTITFRSTNGNITTLLKDGSELRSIRLNAANDTLSNISSALRIGTINFQTLAVGPFDNAILRVTVVTESTPDQEVGNRQHRHRATAQRDIYLRNMHL